MGSHPENKNKEHMRRQITVLAGVGTNVLLAFITHKLGLPLYLDTIGTMSVTVLCGSFAGVLTAVLTNLFCSTFNGYALYFSIINVLVALCAAQMLRRETKHKVRTIILFLLLISLISGVMGTIFQWYLMDDSQFGIVSESAEKITSKTGIPFFISTMAANFLLNLIDKTISACIARFSIRFISPEHLKVIKDSDWKQKPLSKEELKSVNKKGCLYSLRGKTIITIMMASVLPVSVMTWIGLKLYFENALETYTKDAQNATQFVASYIDPDRVRMYYPDGENSVGYLQAAKLLEGIRNNSHSIKHLYVMSVNETNFTYILDPDSEEERGHKPGSLAPFTEDFEPYLPALHAGEETGPIMTHGDSGRGITVCSPVKEDDGTTAFYVCADVSMESMSEYAVDFVVRTLMILSGFFILALSFGFTFSGYHLVYPIRSITRCANRFINGSGEQDEIDENVRKIRSLNIHTGDELEELYRAICKMESNTAEQLRAIRRYGESFSKMQNGLIVTMADMVENRDSDTGAHVQKTAAYVKIILEGLKKKGYYSEKITPKYIKDVVMSAPLHDVGKINITDTILNKPGRLTDEEFSIMKTHTSSGRVIMDHAISTVEGESYLKEARNMAAYHHERWDGKGYPEGLHGEAIPLSARIMSVADVFDALTSKRVYKPAYTLDKALEIIKEGSGTQFDAKCVEAFMDSLPEVKEILKKYNGMETEVNGV